MGNARRLRRRLAGAPNAHRVDLRPVGLAALVEGRLNAHKCPACRGYTVTITTAHGTTAQNMPCLASDGCEGTAFSLGYPLVEAWPDGASTTPTHEWYRPGDDELAQLRDADPDTYATVVAGGLLLRPWAGVR